MGTIEQKKKKKPHVIYETDIIIIRHVIYSPVQQPTHVYSNILKVEKKKIRNAMRCMTDNYCSAIVQVCAVYLLQLDSESSI